MNNQDRATIDRFSKSQIIKMLCEQESGRSITEICKQYKISTPIFYYLSKRYSGMDQSQLIQFEEFANENKQLKAQLKEKFKFRAALAG